MHLANISAKISMVTPEEIPKGAQVKEVSGDTINNMIRSIKSLHIPEVFQKLIPFLPAFWRSSDTVIKIDYEAVVDIGTFHGCVYFKHSK